MASLTDPVAVAGRTAPSRVVFGPHETNLARRRELSDRHVAYYGARAAGGAGIVVTETASVHPSDWPYERAPLAEACGPGWSDVANACHSYGSLVLAGLGHSGGQGSSAYSQSAMWAPSRVADVVSREMPVEMEREDIEALVPGFAGAARLAVQSGLDGVEVDAGYCSLLRQFHSGLTNQRSDEYGSDRLLLTTQVLEAVRDVVGPDRIVALRLCCDELAPWAGVTPEQAAVQVGAVADRVDLVVVVRGGPYSASAYRPDAHTPANFNVDLCRHMRQSAAGRTALVLQGSVTEPDAAQSALDDGVCDLVEMTRSQIAEPRLVALVRQGEAARARPCILCNQACRVRDNRNPIVSCVGEPASGHETTEAVTDGTDGRCREVMVVGAGVAGLECARVLSARGHRVRVVERSHRPGGALRAAAVGPGRQRLGALAEWLIAECRIQGVGIETGVMVTEVDLDTARAGGVEVVLATGSRPAPLAFPVDGSCPVVDALTVLTDGSGSLGDGPVVVHDPVGGPIGIGIAEWLAASGLRVSIVTQDQIAGTLLSLSGDLADANTRLQQAGVRRELRALLRGVEGGRAVLEDVWTGERRTVECGALVDCGHRLPDEALYTARPGTLRAGDCVAPRGVLEAVLEGRRRAMDIAGGAASLLPAGAGAAS
ncbi:MAG: mycofactocin system FadH/OYE family oxidoreductase 1 [Acidimicrobiales bacterium]|nr:mycofactocin system FadH/OYE family oxidoreductase 1 [Acidimicrobiales bacterium]